MQWWETLVQAVAWCHQTTKHNLSQCWPCSASKVHGANMRPTWVLSAPDGPHVGPMNLAIRVFMSPYGITRPPWCNHCMAWHTSIMYLCKWDANNLAGCVCFVMRETTIFARGIGAGIGFRIILWLLLYYNIFFVVYLQHRPTHKLICN